MEHDAVMNLVVEKYMPLILSCRLTKKDYEDFMALLKSAEKPSKSEKKHSEPVKT